MGQNHQHCQRVKSLSLSPNLVGIDARLGRGGGGGGLFLTMRFQLWSGCTIQVSNLGSERGSRQSRSRGIGGLSRAGCEERNERMREPDRGQ